jgi:hypothetical protein
MLIILRLAIFRSYSRCDSEALPKVMRSMRVSPITANLLYATQLPGAVESDRLKCTPERYAVAERISMMCSNQYVDIS